MLTLSNVKPDFIYRDDKPVAAIIDIEIFNEIIDKFEDEEDIAYLKDARNGELSFREFNDYLKERE